MASRRVVTIGASDFDLLDKLKSLTAVEQILAADQVSLLVEAAGGAAGQADGEGALGSQLSFVVLLG